MTNKLNTFQKRTLLREYAELLIFLGYDVTEIMGRPLNYFDFHRMQIRLDELKIEKNQVNKI